MSDRESASADTRALGFVRGRAVGPGMDRALRVTVHFHPDRLAGEVLLLERLAADGVYRSQFETRTSNGGLTAHPGGERWAWESRLFGGAYDGAPPSARPKYGSLNHRRRREGGSIRFGSAHLRLSAETLERTTFCYPDSVFGPTELGTAEHLGLVALAEADEVAGTRDRLDDYVEAHVHGEVRLDRDVEALVLDPAHRGTEVEAAARALPVAVEWHQGFRLHVDELAAHTAYRGSDVVEVGRRLAEAGWLDAAVVGRASRARLADEQLLKRLWHCVARWGGPAGSATAESAGGG